MLFSKFQLEKLAQVNSANLHELVTRQKALEGLQLTKKQISNNIKSIIKTKSDLPGDSGLFKSSLDLDVLKALGYKDLDELINKLSDNEKSIAEEFKKVGDLKNEVQSSLKLIDDIDVTKDMEEQVINEVILDSQISDIREKSHEILLMLSTEKDSSFLSKSRDMIKSNESKISGFITKMRDSENDNNIEYNKNVDKFNTKIDSMNSQMESSVAGNDSFFSKVDEQLSSLTSVKKNIILGGVFVSSLLFGLKNKSSDTERK